MTAIIFSSEATQSCLIWSHTCISGDTPQLSNIHPYWHFGTEEKWLLTAQMVAWYIFTFSRGHGAAASLQNKNLIKNHFAFKVHNLIFKSWIRSQIEGPAQLPLFTIMANRANPDSESPQPNNTSAQGPHVRKLLPPCSTYDLIALVPQLG